jgi:hypothetical protein
VPDFLAAPPRDLMDGQPLRYRLNSDGSFVLYSVGEDGQDEGGDPSTAVSDKDWQNEPPWAGRDWVWPRAVVDAKAGASRGAPRCPSVPTTRLRQVGAGKA